MLSHGPVKSGESHIKSGLKMQPHSVFKKATKLCTHKDHYESVSPATMWRKKSHNQARAVSNCYPDPRSTKSGPWSVLVRHPSGHFFGIGLATLRTVIGPTQEVTIVLPGTKKGEGHAGITRIPRGAIHASSFIRQVINIVRQHVS